MAVTIAKVVFSYQRLPVVTLAHTDEEKLKALQEIWVSSTESTTALGKILHPAMDKAWEELEAEWEKNDTGNDGGEEDEAGDVWEMPKCPWTVDNDWETIWKAVLTDMSNSGGRIRFLEEKRLGIVVQEKLKGVRNVTPGLVQAFNQVSSSSRPALC